jgi:hypothetical protein
MTGIIRQSTADGGDEAFTSAFGCVGFALAAGCAIQIDNGFYSRPALFCLTIGLALLAASLFLPARARKLPVQPGILAWTIAAGIVLEASVLLSRGRIEPLPIAAIVAMAIFGFLQVFGRGRFKIVLIALALAAFSYAGVFAIHLPNPGIDVFDWQQQTSVALTELHNPYELRIAPRFPRYPGFYPPSVVDERGYLNCALPYPPLSLLMVLPGFVFGNDIRYALLVAIAASAALMAFARPGRIAALAAILFLLTPRVLYVLWNSWTEPLMVLNFSLLMFCACRWRKGLPWALGLFLATKQTAIWAVPLLPLLVEGPKRWKQLLWIAIKAGIVVAVINAPFAIWNFRQFVRAVVLLRVVPSFRSDALTYLVWIYSLTGRIPPLWIGSVVAAAAVGLLLWKAPRTPAGFAASVTLTTTLFFAFSKQAFANYYYLTIAMACWAIAAAQVSFPETGSQRAAVAGQVES